MSEVYDAIVIGAGQAGLAAGYRLMKAGMRFIVIEAAAEPGGSWSSYYDSLTLFSPTRYSSLPGFPFPGNPDDYPRRDEVTAYLKEYALRFDFPLVTNTRVEAVELSEAHFLLRTDQGDRYCSRGLIGASGSFSRPSVPRLPGQERFRGTILHSAEYRNASPFEGKRVVVVGAANSAVQIAFELAGAADVTLATRKPVRFVPQRLLGCDFHCWVRWTGLDYLPWLKDQSTPVLDTGKYRKAIVGRQLEQREMFVSFTEEGVEWPNGRRERADAVIFATGFGPSFPYLSRLGALDGGGKPLHRKGVSTVVPGLCFVGLSSQRSFRSATLRGVGADAAYVVQRLRQHLSAAMRS